MCLKRRRTLIGAVALWSLVFCQAAMAAHACMISASGSPHAMAQGDTSMPAGCAGMADRSGSTANTCEGHWIGVHQVQGSADLVGPVVAPPALVVRSNEPRISSSCVTVKLFAPRAAAPPPLLRYCRFLI